MVLICSYAEHRRDAIQINWGCSIPQLTPTITWIKSQSVPRGWDTDQQFGSAIFGKLLLDHPRCEYGKLAAQQGAKVSRGVELELCIFKLVEVCF